MNRLLAISLMVLGLGTVADAQDESSDTGVTNKTMITSDRLQYDTQEQVAYFEGSVHVSDPRLEMYADKLWVYFDENNRAKSIRARGTGVPEDWDAQHAVSATTNAAPSATNAVYAGTTNGLMATQASATGGTNGTADMVATNTGSIEGIAVEDGPRPRRGFPDSKYLVRVFQMGRYGECEELTYELATGELVLSGHAWVKQDENLLRGEKIRAWRDEQRVISEENVEFTFFMDQVELNDARGRRERGAKP